ncbi:hypothetical protein CVT25_003345 [Psilocybe cyanescens]|uniref:F-box domain-containing protein n=1 Tax=Psilocybe cyanescens TaxID=93625 RepID=A0A409X044_PSICY|nr:hypothetical protein CVT25_003345 [Psilocybe cyanescens]
MDSLLKNIARLRLVDSDTVFGIDAPGAAITRPSQQFPSINDLPPEILLEIFLFCGLPDKKRPKHKALEASLRIGTVCRWWRKISLGCSDMWARCFSVAETSRETMKMILRRVKNDGIHFVLPNLPTETHRSTGQIVWPSFIDFWKTARNADLLGRAMSKSRSLSAPLTIADGKFLQWGPIRQRLSQLDKISLELTNIRECLMLEHGGLYDMETQARWSTRSLTLVNCFFPLNPIFFPSLQDLSITGLVGSKVALTPQSWLDILAELPQLRRLTLQDAMTDCQAQSLSSKDSSEDLDHPCPWTGAISDVCLPLLELLNIGSEFKQCTDLLNGLAVPATCDIFVYFHSLWEICTSDFSSMTSWIQNRFNKDEPTLGQILFMQMSNHTFAVRNSTSPVFNLQADFMREYDADGNVAHDAAFTPDEIFHALVEPLALPCRYIRDLQLLIDCEFNATEHQNFWAHTFTPFIAVEKLSLLSHDSFCFMVPICQTGGFVDIFHRHEWKKMTLFPRLQTLSSRDVNFVDPISDLGNISLGKRLLNLVKIRRVACLGGQVSNIKKIDIKKGNMGKQPGRKDCLKMALYGVQGL